jgi:hypothetical protein
LWSCSARMYYVQRSAYIISWSSSCPTRSPNCSTAVITSCRNSPKSVIFSPAPLPPSTDAVANRIVIVLDPRIPDMGRIDGSRRRSQARLSRTHPELAEQIRTEASYFEDNKERMRYPQFRKQGLFVGSGVVEAGCKTVLGRLKQSGMFWTVRGANAIIGLRCSQLSGRFEDYCESRRAQAQL